MDQQPQFVDNGDGTVTDNQTGLMWTKKDSWQIHQDWLDFKETMAFVDEMNKKDYLGFHDWFQGVHTRFHVYFECRVMKT